MNIENLVLPGKSVEEKATPEEIENKVRELLADSLNLLQSKIGTINISNTDKYQEAYDQASDDVEQLVSRAVSETWDDATIKSMCEEEMSKTYEFDSKMEQFLSEYRRY